MWNAIEEHGHSDLNLELLPDEGKYIAEVGENEWIEHDYVNNITKDVTQEMLRRKEEFERILDHSDILIAEPKNDMGM